MRRFYGIRGILLLSFFIACLLFCLALAQAQPYQYDWPTLAHDMKRSGSTAVGPDGPYTKVWYRDFWSEFQEQIASGYQPIVVKDQIHNIDLAYIGTVHGSFYALELNTGEIYWKFDTNPNTGGRIGGILASPTFDEGVIYVGGLDGNVYALDGTQVINKQPAVKWVFAAKDSSGIERIGGFYATPVVTSDTVYIGGRDGYFYAINKANGTKKWEYKVEEIDPYGVKTIYPILSSPAYDGTNIYFGAENMKAYALNATNGALIWESSRMAGQTLRGNYPVIVSDKVIFRTTPNEEVGAKTLNENEQLLAWTAGCLDYPLGAGGTEREKTIPCFNWKATATAIDTDNNGRSDDYDREDQAIRNYLSGQETLNSKYNTKIFGRPQFETFHVLNKADGKKPYIAPVLWTAGMSNPGVSPVVAPDGKLWVVFRSYYSDYDNPSWFIMGAFGEMNPAIGQITIRNPNPNPTPSYYCNQYSCNDWWRTMVWLICDETTAFSIAGNTNKLYINQWRAMGSVELNTGNLEPVVTHGYDLGNALTGNRTRSHAFSTPPSVLDIINGPAIFGDKIVVNSHSVVGMVQGRLPGVTPSPLPTAVPHPYPTITPTQVADIVIPTDPAVYEKYIWQTPKVTVSDSRADDLKTILETEISNFATSGRLAPWIFTPGKMFMADYFMEPQETAYYLSLAYPHLNNLSLQNHIRNFVNQEWTTISTLRLPWDFDRYAWDEGLVYNNGVVNEINPLRPLQRLLFTPGPFDYCLQKGSINGLPCEGNIYQSFYARIPKSFERFYEIWSYAYQTGDWTWVETNWGMIQHNNLTKRITFDTNNDGIVIDEELTDSNLLGLPTDPGVGGNGIYQTSNLRLAALIGYARIAHHMNQVSPSAANQAEVNWAVNASTKALQARLRYVNNFRPDDGDMTNTDCAPPGDARYDPNCRHGTWDLWGSYSEALFLRRGWIEGHSIPQYGDMTPEVGRFLNDYALLDFQRYEKFIDISKPTFYLQKGPVPVEGPESLYSFPHNMHSIFLAKALVNRHDGDYLRKYLDIPWVKQDYFYWERLVRTIEAYGTTSWCDVRTGNCTVPSPVRGDVNQDNQVNILDVQACVNHILGLQDLGGRGDVNGDSGVDVLDVQVIVNIILGG